MSADRTNVLVAACGNVMENEVTMPDGRVDVNDLLYIIGTWGSTDCVADIDGNASVEINDLLAVITSWGACGCYPPQAPVESLTQTLNASNLSTADWNEYMDVLGTGTVEDKVNYNCWMQRYLTKCERCPACPGRDPFVD